MGRKLTIYPDTCFYRRLFDLRTTSRVAREAKTVNPIVQKCKTDGHQIIGSVSVSFEIRQIADARLRANIEAFYYKTIDYEALLLPVDLARAAKLEARGLDTMDSYHLAIAESQKADILLTTDIDFLLKCNLLNLSNVELINPFDFWNGGFL